MYFFRSLVLVFIIIVACFFLYQYLLDNKNLNIGKKKTILLFLALVQGLFILFSGDILLYIFLDFSCFLAYKIGMKKEAFLLSLVNILYFVVVLDIPFYIYLVYLIYFIIDNLFANKKINMVSVYLFIKCFVTSFLYFIYFNYSGIEVLYLVASLIYFAFLLKLSYIFLKNYEEKKYDNSIIFQLAHEVKNPIAVCKGYLDMLDTSKKDKVNKYIPIVKSEMNRALTIMDDFLNLKRLTVNKDIMDLTLLIEDVTATMNSILSSKNIILELEGLDDELILEGDYDRLKQVFINLIKNAYEANAQNIKILIDVVNNDVEVKIIDNGDGISDKDLKKIGQLFYTTKVKGTGIGVSLSKEIIKLHDGKLRYISKLGEGTQVILTLPYQFKF